MTGKSMRRLWLVSAAAAMSVLSCGSERTPAPGCPPQRPWNAGTLFEIVTDKGDTLIACNYHVRVSIFGGRAECADVWLRGGGQAQVCGSHTVRRLDGDDAPRPYSDERRFRKETP